MYKYGLVTSNPEQTMLSCKSDKHDMHELSVSYDQDLENNTSLDHQMLAEKNQEFMRKRKQLKRKLQQPLDNEVNGFFNKMKDLNIQCQEIQSDGQDPFDAREISASRFQGDQSGIQNPQVQSQIIQQQIFFSSNQKKTKLIKNEFDLMKKYVISELQKTKSYISSTITLIFTKLPLLLNNQQSYCKMCQSDAMVDSQRSKASRLQMQLEALTELYQRIMQERDQIKSKYMKLNKQFQKYAFKQQQASSLKVDSKIQNQKQKRIIKIQQQIDQIKPISSMKTIRIGEQHQNNQQLTREIHDLKHQLNIKKKQCNDLNQQLYKLQTLGTNKDKKQIKYSEKSEIEIFINQLKELEQQKKIYCKEILKIEKMLQKSNLQIKTFEKQLKQQILQNKKKQIEIKTLNERISTLEQIKFDYQQKQLNLDIFIDTEVRNRLQSMNLHKKQCLKNLQRKYTVSAAVNNEEIQQYRNRQNSDHHENNIHSSRLPKTSEKISDLPNSNQCSVSSKNQIKALELLRKTTHPQPSVYYPKNSKEAIEPQTKLKINYPLYKNSTPDIRSQFQKSRVSSTSIMKNDKAKRYESPIKKQNSSKINLTLQTKLNKLQADIHLELKNIKENKI